MEPNDRSLKPPETQLWSQLSAMAGATTEARLRRTALYPRDDRLSLPDIPDHQVRSILISGQGSGRKRFRTTTVAGWQEGDRALDAR
jgi:hypothetical protein